MHHLCRFVPPFFKFLQKVTTRTTRTTTTTTTATTFKLIERDARVETPGALSRTHKYSQEPQIQLERQRPPYQLYFAVTVKCLS